MIFFALVTGVAGNFIFDFVKPAENPPQKQEQKITVENPMARPPEFIPAQRIDQGVHKPNERPTTSGRLAGSARSSSNAEK